MSTSTKIAKPRKTEIVEYLRLKNAKTEHERESRTIGKRIDPIKRKLEAYLRQETKGRGGTKAVRLFGFVLSLIVSRGRVAWKDVAIAECSEETIKGYEDRVPDREVLDVRHVI